jgi:hemolysin III
MTGQMDAVESPRPSSSAINVVEEFAEHLVESVANVLSSPRARGWIHVYSAGVAVVAGATLVAASWSLNSTRAGLATLTYAAATVVMFGVSAIYHRVRWRSVTARKWMTRADHSMIFVFIAATFTPFAVVAMPRDTGLLMLTIVWGGALAGVALKMCWPSSPRWVGVPLYLVLGWVAVAFVGTLLDGAGVTATVLLVVGGVLYNIGAVMYALKWPDPWPATFGHHEFFHACTALAATCHYIAIWLAVF